MGTLKRYSISLTFAYLGHSIAQYHLSSYLSSQKLTQISQLYDADVDGEMQRMFRIQSTIITLIYWWISCWLPVLIFHWFDYKLAIATKTAKLVASTNNSSNISEMPQSPLSESSSSQHHQRAHHNGISWLWLQKHKLASPTELPFAQMAPIALMNELCVFVLTLPLFAIYPCRLSLPSEQQYSFGVTLLWVVAYSLGYDVVFYIGHRLLHSGVGYLQRTHSLHHQSRATGAISHHYQHFIDFIIEVFFPGLLPVIVLGLNPAGFMAFMGVGNIIHCLIPSIQYNECRYMNGGVHVMYK
jgi:sterol desaturase/sphingolipid hydroxylase (fatty acid hydroxylase superfamily)